VFEDPKCLTVRVVNMDNKPMQEKVQTNAETKKRCTVNNAKKHGRCTEFTKSPGPGSQIAASVA